MAMTMTELANRLNLSQSTVSLVLNNRDKGRVRPELAERVRREAAATGFRLNRAAADLRRRRSNTIGVALAYSNNFYRAELVTALHAEIIRRGYRPLFAFFHNDMEQQSATGLLLDNNLDAIITLEPQWLPDHLDLPVVSLFHRDPRFDAVVQDVEAGLRLSLECLRKAGIAGSGGTGTGWMTNVPGCSRLWRGNTKWNCRRRSRFAVPGSTGWLMSGGRSICCVRFPGRNCRRRFSVTTTPSR